MTKWINRKNIEIPLDKEVLIIWKGRIGILFRDSDNNKNSCAICPNELSVIMNMDEECLAKIDYWMELPKVLFRCEQEERNKKS